MKAVILAGGSGTRLWPMSRKGYPKQFLRFNSERSLLQQTAERLMNLIPIEDIIIITNNEYRFHILSDIRSIAPESSNLNIILEPVSRNTAPAIALVVRYCTDKLGLGDEEVLFVSPSDHIIKPVDRFIEYLRKAEEIAKGGHIVTFGIKPDMPETGYGYIKVKRQGIFEVERFVEKPDIATARRYLDDGNYYWNSGMFAFTIGLISEELKRLSPEIGNRLSMSYDEMLADFNQMPDISIDYAVMERSNRIAMLPLDIYWNDIGSWDSIYDAMEKDERGNAIDGNVISIDTRDSLIIGNKRLISTIGLEETLIVETDDAILIAKRGQTQRVKDVVNMLKDRRRKEVDEHLTTYRPWGSYTVLEEGPRYKIKRLVVNPKERLSLQMHYHRSEHWVVVKGTAKVRIGEKEILIHENESAYVPKSTLHRLENPGRIPLEIIEVQNGEYIGEDDIERFDDKYGR